MKTFTKALAVAATAAALLLTGCAPTVAGSGQATDDATAASAEGNFSNDFDITELCGDDEIEVALTYGAGGNTWRKIVLAELEAEAAKCDNITAVHFADAGNDPQKAAADIAGFVAQGVDVIIPLPDHGDAMLPSIREAYNAGTTIVPFWSPLNGTAGTDFTEQIGIDYYGAGVDMAKWMLEQIPSGNVVMLGGIAACDPCHEMFEGAKKTLEGTDLTLLGDDFVATDYSPEPAERAVAGLIAQYGQIDGLMSDYGVTTQAALAAFEEAGQPMPAVALANGQNSVYCGWREAEEAGAGYPLAAWEGGTQLVRTALRWALADLNGIEYDEPKVIAFDRAVDTPAGVDAPECEPSSPDDKDMFSGLTDEEISAAIG
jgi:ribose transport system substrate-binding protein